mmetsp:Transcript_1975/g.1434  ORF Transcript_1975/g.1434 Transcript_1975/m.1434 type:complete len:84 (-) Transcript_1975:45-296(-)
MVGRPNLLCLPIYPVQEDKSLHLQAGCFLHFVRREVWVWSFLDQYPPRVEIDCSLLSPNYPVLFGDLEKMLPHGMYLHKQYQH